MEKDEVKKRKKWKKKMKLEGVCAKFHLIIYCKM